MIKSTRNQIGNAKNYYQGSTKKVLAVCSAGILRSATLQNLLIRKYGYNVRNCGTASDFALIPLSEALVAWADVIVFVHQDNYIESGLSQKEQQWLDKDVVVFKIEDDYEFNNPELVELLQKQWDLYEELKKDTPEEHFFRL